MNANQAFLFAALVSEYHQGHFVDVCSNAIIYGADEAVARKTFEAGILARRSANPDLTRIEEVAGAPVLDQLLTESGACPINWPEVLEESARLLESTEAEEQEQGYWVDCEQAVPPDDLPSTMTQLEQALTEDIRSGLNWSADRTYFFLISVLSPPPAFIAPTDEEDSEGADAERASSGDLDERRAAFPQLAHKEAAVLVRARNSVVAACLWRKHAAGTPLARHAIRLDSLCFVAPAEIGAG